MMKKPLPRRTFLRGTGVALALPFLEAMLPFNRSWAAEPGKLAILFKGLGLRSDPAVTGLATMHPEIRNLLTPFDSYATYLSGVINAGITDNHTELPGFMAGTNMGGYKQRSTVDRVAADLLNSGTLLKDGLYIGTQTRRNGGDDPYRSRLDDNMSQKMGSSSTLYHDPRKLFDLITGLGGFSANGSSAAPPDSLKRDVLSLALDGIKTLKRELSPADNITLDRHLTAVEQIQAGMIQTETPAQGGQCATPTGLAPSYPDNRNDVRLPVLADIAALAMNCDLTRALAFLILPDKSGGDKFGNPPDHHHLYDALAATWGSRPAVGYHNWSHNLWKGGDTANQNKNRCKAAMLAGDLFDTSIVVRFLNGLNTNVLESSVVAYGSGGQYNGAHPVGGEAGYHPNIPLVLFGKLNGQIKPKGAVPVHHEVHIGNVWLTLLKSLGYQGNSFGSHGDPTKTISLT